MTFNTFILKGFHPAEYFVYFWEWTKLVFSILWSHLPLFLLFLVIGALVGCLASYFLFRFFKRSPFMARHAGMRKRYSYWLKTAKVLSILALFSFCVVTAVCLAARKAVKIEVTQAVDSGLTAFAEYFFGSEVGREQLETVYVTLIGAGQHVETINQALAETLAEQYTANTDRNGFLRYFDSIFLVGRMKSIIEDVQKKVTYLLIEIALEAVKMEDLVTFDSFESAFDDWLEQDLSGDLTEARDYLTHLIWKYIGPAVTSIFLPAFLVLVGVFSLPFMDSLIYRHLQKKALLAPPPPPPPREIELE